MNEEQEDFNPHNDDALPLGCPSPSQDYIDSPIDFNELLIENEVATFAVRITGDSMIGSGIYPNDIAVVNRAKTPVNGSVIVALLNGQFTVKRYCVIKDGIRLVAENSKYSDIPITENSNFEVWGVLTHSIRTM
jgi:DNA polymerase V